MHTLELFLFFKCYYFLENRVRQFIRRANFAASALLIDKAFDRSEFNYAYSRKYGFLNLHT